ncbi:MAG TPA: hypothetical protein PKA64_10915, partial [Myxococcota bacterium]|nr:hypothetical protein [Myxococcota bacterium]
GAAALAPALLLAALGVQPLLNTSIVPVETLRAFRVRYNTRAFRTEYEQWTYMRGNARAWVALGEALHQLEEPGDSIVLGAIGAVGYHTELTVYDRFGLVSPEVLDAPEEDGKRRSPGHERAVPISFFLPHEPTVLRAELASPTLTDAALLRRTAEWPRDLDIRTRWGPAAVPVVVDGRPRLLLMLLRSDEAPEQWRAWEERGRARPRELAEPAPP